VNGRLMESQVYRHSGEQMPRLGEVSSRYVGRYVNWLEGRERYSQVNSKHN
jgi:hypothetical protein